MFRYLVVALFGSTAFASKVTYVEEPSQKVLNEKIHTVLVESAPQPYLVLYSENIGCTLKTKSFDEALSLQEKLMADVKDQIWIQCFGKVQKNESASLINAHKFTLGRMGQGRRD